MGDISTWSPTAADNNQTPPDGWPEGMAPSQVNNSAREDKAAIRRWYEDAEYLDYGFTPTQISGTKFSVSSATSTATAWFSVNRRIKALDGSNTFYGYVTEASVSGATTNVTVTLDSGALTSSLSSVDVASVTTDSEGSLRILDEDDLSSNSQYAVASQQSIKAYVDGGSTNLTNMLVNGDFTITQRGTDFNSASTYPNNDDSYLFDQWLLLSDGNDVVDVSSLLAGGSNNFANLQVMRADQETANKQWAFANIVECRTSKDFASQTFTGCFIANLGGSNATVETVRVAIVEWQGTANSVTSDIISTWNGGGTDPGLTTNWAYVAKSDPITLTNAGVNLYSVSGTTSSSATNIALLIWLDDTDATVGDLVNFRFAGLTPGAPALPADGTGLGSLPANLFEYVSPSKQLKDCQRYFRKSYNIAVAPGTASSVGALIARPAGAFASIIGLQESISTMRTTGTITWYSTNSGTADRVYNIDAAADGTVSTTGQTGASFTGYPDLSAAISANDRIRAQYTISAEL